jgi:hypothetical protein
MKRSHRSDSRTDTSSPFDFSDFSVISGWNTVYDFGKRIAGLAAFVIVSTALIPLWSPGQTALQYQLNENTRQIQLLQNVPADLAVVKQEISDLRSEVHDTKESINSIKYELTLGGVGTLAFLASWIFNLFGGKLRQRKDAA